MEFSNPFARSDIKARPTFHTTNTMNTSDEYILRNCATTSKIDGPLECRKKIKLQPCSNVTVQMCANDIGENYDGNGSSCSKSPQSSLLCKPKTLRNNAKRSGSMLKRVLKMIKLKANARQIYKKSTKFRHELLKKRQAVQNTTCSINRNENLTDNEHGLLKDNDECCKNESKTVETKGSLTDNSVNSIEEKLSKNYSYKNEDISTDEIQETLNTLASNISVLNKVIKELEARVDSSLKKTSNRNAQKYKRSTFTQKTLSLIKYPLILGMTGAGSYFMTSNYIYNMINLHYGNIPSAALASLIFATSKVMSSFL